MSETSFIPKFPASHDSLHAELRKRVQQYFDEKGINVTGTMSLFTKASLMIAGFIIVYVQLLIWTPIWYIAIPECIILGGLIAGIGFNVMHDGSHGSFSKYKWKNKVVVCKRNLVNRNRGFGHYTSRHN